jgi:hypothetical protein
MKNKNFVLFTFGELGSNLPESGSAIVFNARSGYAYNQCVSETLVLNKLLLIPVYSNPFSYLAITDPITSLLSSK